MKIKIMLIISILLLCTPGCTSANAESLKMTKNTHVLEDFTNIKLGMTHDEVIEILGEEADTWGYMVSI